MRWRENFIRDIDQDYILVKFVETFSHFFEDDDTVHLKDAFASGKLFIEDVKLLSMYIDKIDCRKFLNERSMYELFIRSRLTVQVHMNNNKIQAKNARVANNSKAFVQRR